MKYVKLGLLVAAGCLAVTVSPSDLAVTEPLAPTTTGGTTTTLEPPAPTTAPGAPLGVFRGTEQSDRIDGFEEWLGHRVAYTLDFLGRAPGGGDPPWTAIDDPSDRCAAWAHDPREMVLSVAMLPDQRHTLAKGATGAYAQHWRRFGQALVDGGCEAWVLRLGWEFNGRFYPWAAGGQEADFAAYWRDIVEVLRSVPGQRFRFDWTALAGNANADVEAAYPGDAYVDIIGLDAYDTSEFNDPEERWRDQLERPFGLQWHAQFAAAHGKPMAFPEWGVAVRRRDDLGGGDAPRYVEHMVDWIRGHDVVYAIYFDIDASDADHQLSAGQFPRSGAALRRLAPLIAGAPI